MRTSTLSPSASDCHLLSESSFTTDTRLERVIKRDVGVIPIPPYVPLWQFRRGRILGPLWIFHSPKARRIVRLRGNIVYYAWLLLEADPDVAELCEQPFAVRIFLDGRWRSALVDIWAKTRSGGEFFVVAGYRRHLAESNGRSSCRANTLTAWATQSGAVLAVMPDMMIWRHPQYLSNWAHIVRFLGSRRVSADRDLIPLIHRAFGAQQRMTLRGLECSFPEAEPTAVRTSVFRLLHAGVVRADLRHERISGDTVFELV